MRILWVIGSLGRGGAERVSVVLCNGLARRGHRTTLVTIAGIDEDGYRLLPEVERVALDRAGPSGDLLRGVARNLARARALRRAVAALRPDMVVSFILDTNVVALLATRGLRVPTLISERCHPAELQLGRAWRIARARLYRRAARLVVPCAALVPPLRHLLPADRMLVIPNPLAPEILEPAPDLGDYPQRRTVLGVGRLAGQKSYPMLIEAFGSLAVEFPDFRLRIVGEGEERPRLESLVARLGLGDRVELPGVSAQVRDEYDRAAVFVLSSRREGFPNVVSEAMSRGLPVLATDCPTGPADLIDSGVDGLLSPVGDPAAFADRLRSLLGSVEDRSRLGRAALRVRARLAPDVVVDRWEETFRGVLA